MEQRNQPPIQPDAPRPLAAYRVVELAGAPQLPAGKAFADLGAEVIKVEPPGGDPARMLPPTARLPDGREIGLYWTAYNLGKSSVIADIETADGRDVIRRLVAGADVMIEGYAPGVLGGYGLGFEHLQAENPRLVLTSITPFGQTGPYAGRKGSDLVQLAMSGYLYMTGPKDGTPIKPSAPYQTFLHGSMQAVAATLLALRNRRRTGEGAHVDQAMRDTGLWMLTHTYQFYDLLGVNLRRQGAQRDMGGVLRLPTVYRCLDGYVVWLFQTGHIGGKNTHALVQWMSDEGMAPDWLREQDWMTFDLLTAGPEMTARLAETFGAFFRTKRKAELFEWAIGRGVMLAPVQTLRDVAEDIQLATREAWRTFDLEGHGPVWVPGPPIRLGDGAWEPRGGVGDLTSRADLTPRLPSLKGWGSAVERRLSESSPLPSQRERGPGGEGRLPLAGLRVLDFSTTVAGPSAVRHLADFGAQVIKIESEAHPDTLRFATPYAGRVAGLNRSGYFAAYNAGKLSIALNLQLPEAREIVRRLIERSDVLVEAFVPGVMRRWGFSYEQVSAWNPRIIMASHCLQGQWGPHAKHRGYGQIASAMSGWYDLTGPEGEEPLGPYSAYTDFISWPFLLSAILVALEVREATGRGQYIDHAQLETSIHFLAPSLLDLQLNDRMATRRGNHEDYACPNNAYQCAGDDRWIAITIASDDQWEVLCGVLGADEAARDRRFATFAGRKQHEQELDRLIAGRTADLEPFALAERLQEAGIAAGVVERAEDLFADPQLQHRRFFRRLDHPELGNHAVHTQSFRISGIEAGPARAAPLLGEHTVEICRDVLGMTDDEIAEYAATGVFY
jgi:crotonobetainyl-CoA:carnitine CoA-transferase CaiB-like acyl-CoA transferase